MTSPPRDQNRDESTLRGRYVAAALAAVCVVAFAAPASAWKFDATCGAQSKTENMNLRQAQGYIILDKSGSMGGTKWSEATNAVNSAVSANTSTTSKDVIQFGLGLFSSGASNEVSPKEDAYSDIQNALSANGPGGSTYMAEAVRLSESVLQGEPDANQRPQAGLLITDGKPNGPDSRHDLVDDACQHRRNAGPLYSIGLGTGTDKELNDTVAAAGGTGYCCNNGGDCGPNSSARVDPCNTNPYSCSRYCNWWGYCYWSCSRKSNWECHGARQTGGGTGLKKIINEIANKLACRINVGGIWQEKWSDKPYGCSTDDYNCMSFTHDGLDIDYSPSTPTGSGWRWANEDQQDRVVLNEQTCNKIRKSYTSDTVSVDRACMCGQQTPGDRCTVQNPQTCECTTGTVTCSQSQSQCTPDTNCPQRNRQGFGGPCSVGTGVCERTGTQYCPSPGSPACGRSTGGGGGQKTVGIAGSKSQSSGQSWKWNSIDSGKFSSAPVVLSTTQTTFHGEDPSAAHIATVTQNGFYTQHCELDAYLGSSWCDGHGPEVNGWMAVAPNEVNSLNGMEAGRIRTTGGVAEAHDTINFSSSFSRRPLVFTQTLTANGSDPARNTQVLNVTTNSATVEYCEQQYADSCASHTSETVGWLAVDPSKADLAGVEMGEFTTSDSNWKRISFSSAFPQTPVVIAQVQTENGGQEALYPEVRQVSQTGAEIRYCESDGGDNCDSHASERVAWIAFTPGTVKSSGSTSSWTSISPGSPTEDPEKQRLCDNKDNDCDGQTDEGLGTYCNTGKPGRCSAGEWRCRTGNLTCAQTKRPMPEICNGLDEDCDGTIDDIGSSWNQNWSVDTDNLSPAGAALTCGKTGSCRCPQPSDRDDTYRSSRSAPDGMDQNMTSGDRQDEFDRMVGSTVQNDGTGCVCEE